MKKLFKVSVLTIPYDTIYVYAGTDTELSNSTIAVRYDYGAYHQLSDRIWNMQAPDEKLYDKGQFIGYLFRSFESRNIDMKKMIAAVVKAQKRLSRKNIRPER